MNKVRTNLFLSGVFVMLAVLHQSCGSSETTSEAATDPVACLVGVDWVYPSGESPTGAWKFSSDGTLKQ